MGSHAPANHPIPTHLTRWYIDTRDLTNSMNPALPLLSTLQPSEQDTIQRFHHLKDKHMSLASNLLKYLFIHRSCKVPWDRITLSRTAAPHRRPCFIPSPTLLEEYSSTTTTTVDNPDNPASNPSSTKKTIPKIEFNVSHQASLVALAGTTISTAEEELPQVGIDITCTNERNPTRDKTKTPRQTFVEYVDIFTEVFSSEEIRQIKDDVVHLHHHQDQDHKERKAGKGVEDSYRVFYAYWALKEAYIKMTGEALLAPWLRQLEFGNVVAPEPVPRRGERRVGLPYRGVRTTLDKKRVEDVRVELVAFEEDYLIATAARGAGIGAGSGHGEGGDTWEALREIDIERDVRPCAEGRCRCLE
ncbi:4'-phosphopantetheinyl transferase family protein [Aspergillus homomorphus CBS 101889]|uniref:holo-[acyl-carrier-protein] synthase n=1 Tax=Aspergillus homomorphus (strain CBS 101889) TaxID=1450537 RepID=A0A395IAD5_ASPHC|nr:4'-phosphopantetheinyl transferase [Aspergillus homomorphus CBS 101889]RAL15114.1 4'-phosphopantetheinyl transferase [Aspergillus homomorphus CBS 101889]